MGFLPALLYALLMGAVPLVEVIWHARPPATLLLLYWFETALLLVTGAIRVVLHRRATGKVGHYTTIEATSAANADAQAVRKSLGDGNTYLRSYVGLNAIFVVAHGAFVLLIVFLFDIAGALSAADAKAALLYAIAVQATFLLWDLPRLPQWRFAQLARTVGATSLRVLVTQLGLIFGLPVAALTGSPWGLVGTFVGLRALADAAIAWLQGLLKQRDLPGGFARVLARRSGQSTVALEAEFDRLKEDSRDVEALLEERIEAAHSRMRKRS